MREIIEWEPCPRTALECLAEREIEAALDA